MPLTDFDAIGTLSDPGMLAHFAKTGSVLATREQATPAALSALVKSEVEKWGTVLRNAGFRPE